MRAFIPILFYLVFFSVGLFAQERTLSGKVTSAADGDPLVGVTVRVKDGLIGTVTDLDGNYSLSGLSDQTELVFTFVGFETIEMRLGRRQRLDVAMVETVSELEEVVVTALGIKRQRREIGYSTETIEADVLTGARAPNVLNAISGRAAGVQISQPDGVQGGSTRITIRGNNNIGTDNQPLIVVDGIPIENTPGMTSIGRGVDWGSAINDINAHDIESMTVLKGGAASALYGSRGANGVVLINTKRGGKQRGIGVTYNMDYQMTTPYRYREVQNVYGHGGPIGFTPPTFPMSGDTLLYPGIYGVGSFVINQQGETSSSTAEFGYYGGSVSWGPRMEGQPVKWWDGVVRPYSPEPDNLALPYRSGLTTTHNIAASGGGDRGQMRVSITRQDHEPIIYNSHFNRTTINMGANLVVSDKLRTDLIVTYMNFHRLNSPMLGEDANSFNKGQLYSWPRSYKGLDMEFYALEDGSRNPQDGHPFAYVNPYLWWNYFNNNTTLDRDKYTTALTLTYDITPWLQAMGRVGRDFTLDQYDTRHKPVDAIGLLGGYYSNRLSRNTGDNFDFTLTASQKNILNSGLDISVLGGASRWNNDFYSIGGQSGSWYYPNMYTFFNFTDNAFSTDPNNVITVDRLGNRLEDVVPRETIRRRRTNSVYAYLDLSYKRFAHLQLTGRNDWSSTLPAGSNSYFYPSASLSILPTEIIDFSAFAPWVSFVKLKGSIAQTATDTDPYLNNFYYLTGRFGGQQASVFPDTIPPQNLKPQRVNAYETGFTLGLFDNRIDFDFTWYYLYSFDQIIPDLPVPMSSGSPYLMTNEGILTNRGFEIILNTVPVRTRNLLVRSSINLARNRNHVVSLGGAADVYQLDDIWGLNGPAMILREGDEFGTISGYDYMYDDNGNRIVNDAGTKYLITDTRVPIGNASPKFIAGWNTTLTYKGIRFGMLIDTKWGGDIYAGSYVIGLQTGQSPETLVEREGGGLPYTDPDGNTSNIGIILEGVHEDGTPNSTVVHYYYKYMPNAGGWGKFVSTPGIVENTWVKMREMSLSYTIPQNLLRRVKVVQNLTLSVTGRDLFYIYTTLPDKINPEGILGAGNAQGFEWASYPGTRSVIFGLNASF